MATSLLGGLLGTDDGLQNGLLGTRLLTTNLVAATDRTVAVEAGFNNVGTNPAGNLLTNDAIPSLLGANIRSVTATTAGFAEVAVGELGITNVVGRFGTLRISSDGSYSYLLDNNNLLVNDLSNGQTLTEVFRYEAALLDAVLGINLVGSNADLVITINGTNDTPPPNQAPVAVDDGFVFTEDTGVQSGSVRTNDSDDTTSNAELKYVLAPNQTAPAGFTFNENGTFTIDTADETYQPRNTGEFTTLPVNYIVTDKDGATDIGTLVIRINGLDEPQNQAPVAVDEGFVFTEDTGVQMGSVRTNDTDDTTPNAELKYALAPNQLAPDGFVLAADGTFSIDTANATYQPRNTGDFTILPVNYTVTDKNGATDTGTLTIRINGVDEPANQAPVARNDAIAVTENTGIQTGSVATNDTDADNVPNTLRYELVSVAGAAVEPGTQYPGIFEFNADGTYRINTDAAFFDPLKPTDVVDVGIGYRVVDPAGAMSQATLTVRFTGADEPNQAPVARNDAIAVTENTGIQAGSVATNDTDADNAANTLKYELVSVGGNAVEPGTQYPGIFTFNEDGTYSINTDAAFFDGLTPADRVDVPIVYRVKDPSGTSSQATLTVTFTGANDAPPPPPPPAPPAPEPAANQTVMDGVIYDANGKAFTFIVNAMDTSAFISNFGTNDKIDFADALLSDLVVDTDVEGDGIVTFLSVGNVAIVDVTVTGVPANLDVAGQTLAGLNAAYGAGTFA